MFSCKGTNRTPRRQISPRVLWCGMVSRGKLEARNASFARLRSLVFQAHFEKSGPQGSVEVRIALCATPLCSRLKGIDEAGKQTWTQRISSSILPHQVLKALLQMALCKCEDHKIFSCAFGKPASAWREKRPDGRSVALFSSKSVCKASR